MPPESSDGKFGPGFFGQAGHADLVGGNLVAQLWRELGIEFPERHLDIFGHRQRGKQRAALKQHAPAACAAGVSLVAAVDHRLAEAPSISPSSGFCRPMIERISTDLPVPDPPTTPNDLAAAHVEVQPLMHHLLAEAGAKPAHRKSNGDGVFPCRAHVHPTQVKNTAKNASSTITMKIACTTAAVVRIPTSSALDLTSRP
jgi:hypothetical protein